MLVRFLTLAASLALASGLKDGHQEQAGFAIEGRVSSPEPKPENWFWTARVVVDGGKRFGFLKSDNSFSVSGLQAGSYLVEISAPDYYYEPVRVDITSKGKIRARKVNNLQPNQVNQLSYPLRMKPLHKLKYFQDREEWKITDVLMNPYILMMVLPVLIITVLPKMVGDAETQKEMQEFQRNIQQQQNMIPDVSEVFANFFGGGGGSGGGGQDRNKRKPVKMQRR